MPIYYSTSSRKNYFTDELREKLVWASYRKWLIFSNTPKTLGKFSSLARFSQICLTQKNILFGKQKFYHIGFLVDTQLWRNSKSFNLKNKHPAACIVR